jgi:DNA-binding NarL/FixJ family response regulator
MDQIKVLIVDDHALFRRGIASVLANEESLQLIGEAADGQEAIEKVKQMSPDVVLMDLNMPRCSGLEAVQALQTNMPEVNVLVLTVSEMEADLFNAMKFGAKGYILKNTEPEELIHAILHIARGGVIISPLMASKLLSEFKDFTGVAEREPPDSEEAELSPREGDVLRLVSQGATNREIADGHLSSKRASLPFC